MPMPKRPAPLERAEEDGFARLRRDARASSKREQRIVHRAARLHDDHFAADHIGAGGADRPPAAATAAPFVAQLGGALDAALRCSRDAAWDRDRGGAACGRQNRMAPRFAQRATCDPPRQSVAVAPLRDGLAADGDFDLRARAAARRASRRARRS